MDAAKRLLLQQAGYSSPDWVFLGDFITDAQSGYGRGYYFLARLAVPAEDGADPRVRLLTREELQDAVFEGQTRVLTWQTAFSLALLRLFLLNFWGLAQLAVLPACRFGLGAQSEQTGKRVFKRGGLSAGDETQAAGLGAGV